MTHAEEGRELDTGAEGQSNAFVESFHEEDDDTTPGDANDSEVAPSAGPQPPYSKPGSKPHKLTRKEKRFQRANLKREPLFSRLFVRSLTIFAGLLGLLFVYGVMKMFGILPAPKLPGFKYIKVSNTRQLKDAMTLPVPRLVFCTNVSLEQRQVSLKYAGIYLCSRRFVLGAVAKACPSWIDKVAIDCYAPLPSKKTAYQRFNLDPESTVMFIQPVYKRAISLAIGDFTSATDVISRISSACTFNFKRVLQPDDFTRTLNPQTSPLVVILTDGIDFNMYTHHHVWDLTSSLNEARVHAVRGLLVNDVVHKLDFKGLKETRHPHVNVYCIHVSEGKKSKKTNNEFLYKASHFKGQFPDDVADFFKSCAKGEDLSVLHEAPKLTERVTD